MTNLKVLFIRLAKEDSGQDLIEYALVAALIALGALVGMKTLANDIGDAFNSVGSTLTSAQTPAAG
jgi:pilus assembly protein Flp/PilA